MLNINNYIDYCKNFNKLSPHTIKAYTTDLTQFFHYAGNNPLTIDLINEYIKYLNITFKYRTVKRKVASVKTYFKYLHRTKQISSNPCHDITLTTRPEKPLPKTIPLYVIEKMLHSCHENYNQGSIYTRELALRDKLVIELLFLTGIRVSELCNLHKSDINLVTKTAYIRGKGNKERIAYLESKEVINDLKEYLTYNKENDYLFKNRLGNILSTQAVRNIITKYSKNTGVQDRITPHMFRHTFATSLLEADVDIRYIQSFLGHSSIVTTQIYTQVATSKSRSILRSKHPLSKISTIDNL